jgi:hypothetical protein
VTRRLKERGIGEWCLRCGYVGAEKKEFMG